MNIDLDQVEFEHNCGASVRSLGRRHGASKSTIHARLRQRNPVEEKFSLLRAIHNDYLGGKKVVKLTARQEAEVQAFLVLNQQRLMGKGTYLSSLQEDAATLREVSPKMDWRDGMRHGQAHLEPTEEPMSVPLAWLYFQVQARCSLIMLQELQLQDLG
jgi:hypothetical protein